MPLTQEDIKRLKEKAKEIRKTIVDITFTAGGGHIGGPLSQTDILVALY